MGVFILTYKAMCSKVKIITAKENIFYYAVYRKNKLSIEIYVNEGKYQCTLSLMEKHSIMVGFM